MPIDNQFITKSQERLQIRKASIGARHLVMLVMNSAGYLVQNGSWEIIWGVKHCIILPMV
jgi:hypothetical protein